ncbi:hypothetical protein AB0469_15380 [Streptomyces sp. NPDC093801]|uniref:hypothetical protein n=1 Tax=Streptomyces sp. NPDC093801 TaxID=3155203 RepID=UPI00344E26FC
MASRRRDHRRHRDEPGGLARPDARRILAVAPTPAPAAELPLRHLTAMLKRFGRRGNTEADAERLH